MLSLTDAILLFSENAAASKKISEVSSNVALTRALVASLLRPCLFKPMIPPRRVITLVIMKMCLASTYPPSNDMTERISRQSRQAAASIPSVSNTSNTSVE